jgi:hypothetical protein
MKTFMLFYQPGSSFAIFSLGLEAVPLLLLEQTLVLFPK